ncbi:MAG: ABC transporter substrate-binding protein [Gammaproteobacteria bacterium]|nr:ABC transporter substrate-binding protein [Gammaproteobacteria bacterium]
MQKILVLLLLISPLISAQESVVLQLKWFHQFQFAGYYAAKEKGFYQDAGFDVEIRQRDITSDAMTEVIEGRADFGVSDSSIIVSRLNGAPLVIASTIYQTSPLIFLTTQESNISSPYDLKGKKIMFQRSIDDASLQALLSLFSIKADDYQFVKHNFDDWAIIKGDADVMSAYRSNQPIHYKNENIDVNIIDPASYGVDFYGDLLFTTEQRVKQDIEGVDRFVQATRLGWQYALNNKQEIAQLIIDQYGSTTELPLLLKEAQVTEQMIKPLLTPIGAIFPERFKLITNTYRNLGMVPKNASLEGLLLDEYKSTPFKISNNVIYIISLVTLLLLSYIIFQIRFNAKLKRLVKRQTVKLEKNNVKLEERNNLLSKQKTELEQAKVIAEQANEAKSRFFANMTHELRTPLHGILNMADFALNEDSNVEKDKALSSIVSSTHILSNIVNDILDFSKIEAGRLEIENIDFSLNELIDTITKPLINVAVKKGLKFGVSVEDKIANVLLGDPIRIAQIINNLCSNAIKFTENGEISLEVTLKAEQKNEQTIEFKITDTGIGIDEAAQQKLFQEFQQADASTSRKYGGTGLGLSICSRLSDLLGGKLSFSSQLGEGSTFCYQQTFVTSGLTGINKKTSSTISLARCTVLVAEDNKINQVIITKMLEVHDANIILVENGKDAVVAFERQPIDLVFMDIQMPEMDGVEATKQIRQLSKGSEVPIIAMTANTMKEDIEHYLDIGMDGYLSKPFDREKLNRLLNIYNPNSLNLKKFATKLSDPKIEVSAKLLDICCQLKLMVPEANRVSLWVFKDNLQSIECLVCLDDKNNVSGSFELTAYDYPEYFDFIMNNQVLIASDARSNQYTKCFNNGYFEPLNIYSLLDLIFSFDNKPTGVICCESVEQKVEWQNEHIESLKKVADIASLFIAEQVSQK